IAEEIRNSSFLLLELNFRFFKYFHHPAFSAAAPTPSDVPSSAALSAYERNLRHLVTVAGDDHVAVVIGNESTWIPAACAEGDGRVSRDATLVRTCFGLRWYFPHLSMAGIRRSFEAVSLIQQQIAREHRLIWVDMNRVVPGSSEYYWDFCHTTPRGTTVVA